MFNQKSLLVPSFVTKARWFGVWNKSRRGGKCEYWHSKSITNPKLELLTHLVWKLESLTGCAFYTKRHLCPLSFKWHLGNICSPYGSWATTVTKQGYFWLIQQLSSIYECPGTCVYLKRPLNITLHGNCCNSASKRATMVSKVPFERYWTKVCFLYKIHILINFLVFALDELEVLV